MDIAYLFWSIAVGIVLAAGMIPLAVFGSLLIGIIMILLVNKKTHVNPYIIVLRTENRDAESKATEYVGKNVLRYTVKSKTVTKGQIELNLDIRLKDDNTDFINGLAEMNGVTSAVLVSYNGDFMG